MDSANLLFEIEKKFVLDLGFEGEHKQKVLIWSIKTQSNRNYPRDHSSSIQGSTTLQEYSTIHQVYKQQ